MKQLMTRSRIANEVKAQKKEIGRLRTQLKTLRAKTFPRFDPL